MDRIPWVSGVGGDVVAMAEEERRERQGVEGLGEMCCSFGQAEWGMVGGWWRDGGLRWWLTAARRIAVVVGGMISVVSGGKLSQREEAVRRRERGREGARLYASHADGSHLAAIPTFPGLPHPHLSLGDSSFTSCLASVTKSCPRPPSLAE